MTTLSDATLGALRERLAPVHHQLAQRYRGESGARQPVHTVYGGAHLFKANTAPRLGELALRHLNEYAPDFCTFAQAIGLQGAEHLPVTAAGIAELSSALADDAEVVRRSNVHAWRAHRIYQRVLTKLEREPVEDFRIDFEDGFGSRPDEEEDHHAEHAAQALVEAHQQNTAPPFYGLRIKPLTAGMWQRSLRTLDLFLTTYCKAGGPLEGLLITLPKITHLEQIRVLVSALDALEKGLGLSPKTLRLEFMVETTQSILDSNGCVMLPQWIDAADGRCAGAHFGTYDYTAGCNITAGYQDMAHPACDHAKHVMTTAFGSTGIPLSDGATNIMPVGPHRGDNLNAQQRAENQRVVHEAWRLHVRHIQHSLRSGYYQGWDLHPGQLPTRYAAVFDFFLRDLPATSARLKNFIEQAAQATLVGDVFDDAATGQGLLNFFLRGISCGALLEEEALATGITLEELRGRSFPKIIENRRGK